MHWLVYVLAGCVVLGLVLVVLLGARVPVPHVATVKARFRQPPAKVWETITDMLRAPNWRSGLRQVERHPDRDGRQVWIEVGRRGRLPLEFEVVEPERRLVTHIVGEHLPFGGRWTYDLAPDAVGCILTITEDGEIYSQTFRFFARYVFGYHAAMSRYVKDLGRKLGEKVKPEKLG